MSGLTCFRFFALAISLSLACAPISKNDAFGAEKPKNLRPTAPIPPPSAAARKIPENPFKCDRLIKYKGKILPCDSPLRRDGDGLRSIMESTPEALEELEKYQSGRNSIQFAAYTGTAGILIAILGGTLANLFIKDEKGPDGETVTRSRGKARADVGRVLRYAGAGITLGGLTYGLSVLRTNESHLQQSILKHNAARPDQPIEIQFKAEF